MSGFIILYKNSSAKAVMAYPFKVLKDSLYFITTAIWKDDSALHEFIYLFCLGNLMAHVVV